MGKVLTPSRAAISEGKFGIKLLDAAGAGSLVPGLGLSRLSNACGETFNAIDIHVLLKFYFFFLLHDDSGATRGRGTGRDSSLSSTGNLSQMVLSQPVELPDCFVAPKVQPVLGRRTDGGCGFGGGRGSSAAGGGRESSQPEAVQCLGKWEEPHIQIPR